MDKGTADTLGEHRVMNKVSTSQEMTEMPVEKNKRTEARRETQKTSSSWGSEGTDPADTWTSDVQSPEL